MKATYSYSGETNIGKVRSKNEDAFVLEDVWDGTHLLAVVVDGVGGNFGGDVAASLTCRCICEHINETIPCSNEAEILKAAVIYANNSIIFQQQNPVLSRMGCVMTAALIDMRSGVMHVCHVGDTRLYVYENDCLIKLTSDDSLVGPLEESGQLSELKAINHPRRNVITRRIGKMLLQIDTDYIHCQTVQLRPCTILLCSDGLYDMVTSIQSSIIIGQSATPQIRTRKLINAALDSGGKDNITVCLIDITE